ncbi:MAG TPA: ADP-ribose polymerase [Bacteroidetes bacterium]|nr:ADP-ribose polymerase [Bacteroidota bacterium]
MLNFLKRLISPATSPVPSMPPSKILQSADKAKIDGYEAPAATGAEEGTPLRRHAKLIMVTAANNNKFYEMKENGDGTFTAYYGRVGSSSSTATYPMSKWGSKLREKVRKGYADQTHLFAEDSSATDFADIPDAVVRGLIEDLLKYSRQSILRNYNVAADQVTRKQVEQAQAILDKLAGKVKLRLHLNKFNQDLVALYTLIPRRMTKVADHLIERPSTQEDLKKIEKKLAEEQATLDVMRGEVEAHEQQKAQQPGEKQTLTQALGIQVEPLTDAALIKSIKKMMGRDSGKFHRAFKVANARTQQSFDEYVGNSKNKTTELFWHGSRNENWLSILKTGLVLRPANAIVTGKMFGYGLYFADKFRKSLNYSSVRGSFWAGGTSGNGFLALYDVHLGMPLKIKRHAAWCSQLTEEKLKKRGSKYNSVFAKGGADLINNEYIVYNQAQCTVRYLVEVHA